MSEVGDETFHVGLHSRLNSGLPRRVCATRLPVVPAACGNSSVTEILRDPKLRITKLNQRSLAYSSYLIVDVFICFGSKCIEEVRGTPLPLRIHKTISWTLFWWRLHPSVLVWHPTRQHAVHALAESVPPPTHRSELIMGTGIAEFCSWELYKSKN